MSAHTILQTLGWVPVLWLVTIHLLVDRQRLPRDGWALRIAACAAAGVVVTASIEADMWPLAGLGLLWLRSEVFAHRHPIHEFQAYREQARRNRESEQTPAEPASIAADPGPEPADPVEAPAPIRVLATTPALAPERAPERAPEPAPTTVSPPPRPAGLVIPQWQPPHSSRHVTSHTLAREAGRRTAYKAEHPPPKPRVGPRMVNAIFKIEVMIVLIAILAVFGSWAESHRSVFNHKANTSVCKMMGGC